MNARKIKCPFGVINIGGLIETKPIEDVDEVVGAEAIIPLFCHESYKIKTTFNNKIDKSFGKIPDEEGNNTHYQKKFRRMVLWDFGDGHKEEGYSVEHHYKKPGRYKIRCTLYDINRCAWENTFYYVVVVKEVIPTKLSFVKPLTKTELRCSKIERLTQLEAMLSENCKEDLQIKAKRIFTDKEIDANYEEIGRSFRELDDEILKFTRKYWAFLENEQQLIFQSNKIYGDKLQPKDLFTPNYIQLYGKFYYDKDNKDTEPIKLRIYQVIPYKEIDDNLKTIRVMNPNCKIDELIAHTGDEIDFNDKFTYNIEINQVYTLDQLPKDVFPIGKRAFVDIFYKNDFVTPSDENNRFSFFFDIENYNVTKELLSSDNYLNINPLGLTAKIIKNDVNKVRVGVSLDGFLRQLTENDDWAAKNYYVDPYLMNSLVKDINLDFYLFPYIEYDNRIVEIEGTDVQIEEGEDSDFIASTPMYYVPKDFSISVTPHSYDLNKSGTPSRYITERGVHSIENWLKRVSFSLYDYFACDFTTKVGTKTITFSIIKDDLIKPDEITIPTEKMVNENIQEIIDTYMIHPMFDIGYSVELKNPTEEGKTYTTGCSIKEFFKIILSGNNMLNYALTKSNHFLDDYANIRTCYLSSLIQTLKMMGEDVLEYEKGAFEGVNDLRDFVRILSINHSDLVGKLVNEPYDITIRLDRKGKNVGDEIKLDDILTLQQSDAKFCKGKIIKLTRGGKVYNITDTFEDGVDLIIHDKYTFESRIVNLRESQLREMSLIDYRPSWGWNLLLPKKFDDCVYKLNKNEEYKAAHNGVNLYSTSELNRIKEVMKEQLQGYYGFYLLNPNVDKVRKGNFIDERTITELMDDSDEWDADWGFTHDVLMKIIRDSGTLKHSEIVVENDDLQKVYNRRMVFDDSGYTGIIDTEISNIRANLYNDGLLCYNSLVEGIVTVYGCICGGEEDYLELQLCNANVIEEKYIHRLSTEDDILQFKLKVDDKGVIHPSKQVYKIYSDAYEGTLTVSLCGKLKKEKGELKGFLWDVSIDLYSSK